MTKEEFYNLSATRQDITSPSVFRLIVRTYDKDIKGYRKWRGKDDYYYDISIRSNLYSSKDEAETALHKFIGDAEQFNKAIHSAVIERIPLDVPLEEGGQLEWWLYDSSGKEIDCSTCAWENGEELSLRDVYFGRTPEQIRFQKGDIVEFIQANKAFLVVLNGLPLTVEQMWERYENTVTKKGMEKEGKYPEGYFESSVFSDSYFFLEKNGFDPDFFPYYFVKPTFKIPTKAKTELKDRFTHWKTSN